MRHELRLLVPVGALWCGTWLGLLRGANAFAFVAFVGAVAIAIAALLRRRMPRGVQLVVGALVAAMLGATLALFRLAPLNSPTLQSWAGHRLPVTAVVVVTGEPSAVTGFTQGSFRRPDGWRATATLLRVETTQNRALELRVPVQVGGSGAIPSWVP